MILWQMWMNITDTKNGNHKVILQKNGDRGYVVKYSQHDVG